MESSDDAENANEWELCKENVQPLRQGRKFANLTAALQSNSTDLQNKIRQQKQEFEIELRTYTGGDPLDVWYRYIKWTEQTYPKGGCGKEGNLLALLESCIQRFKDEDIYKNDQRYIDAWLKLAYHQSEPLEIFNFMFSHGIGCMVSNFYVAWASQFEEAGNHKKADTIYQQGMRACAHPIDQLRSRHCEFQARVARQLAEEGDAPMETSDQDPQRNSLAQLKGHGKHRAVDVNRTNVSTKPARGLGLAAPTPQIGGPSFSIFSEDGATSASLPPQSAEYASVPQRAKMRAENEQKPGKWSNAKMKQKTVGTVPISEVSQRSQPAFPIHTDEGAVDPSATPRQSVHMTNNQVLSARKPQKQHNTLQAITNPAMVANNAGEMPMYCKSKVYGGLHELSLEEIRAARWKKNRKEQEVEQRRLEEERRHAEERRTMMEMMKQQQEALEQQRLLFQQMQERQREWEQQQRQQQQAQNDVSLDVELQMRLQINDNQPIQSQDVAMNKATKTSRQLSFAREMPHKQIDDARRMSDDSSARRMSDDSSARRMSDDSSARRMSDDSLAGLSNEHLFKPDQPKQSGIKIFEDDIRSKPHSSGIKIFQDNSCTAKPAPGTKIFEDNCANVKPTLSSFKMFEDNASSQENRMPQVGPAPTKKNVLQARQVTRPCELQEQSIPEDEELVPNSNVSAAAARTPGQHERSWPSNSFSRTRSREPTPDSFYNPFKDSGKKSRESIAAPSPTVNTREAFQLVMGMFNNTLAPETNFGWEREEESVMDPGMEAEYAADSEKPKVTGGCLGTQSVQPFVIFDENEGAKSIKKQEISKYDICDQENRAPSDYMTQPKRTALSGILQPATDIPYQTKDCDYDDEDMFGIEPIPDEDMTFAPCAESTKKFSHLAQMVSTPFPNAANVPLPNPALSNIHVNRTQFEQKTEHNAEDTMFEYKAVRNQEGENDNNDMPQFAKQGSYSLSDQSPMGNFPRPSMGILTPIMEGSSEKSSGNSDNSNNVFCHTGFSTHHPVTELETVDEESLQGLSMNQSKQLQLQVMAMNESKPVGHMSVRDISMPQVTPVSQFKRNMSLRDVPAQDITLPSFAMNESKVPDISMPHFTPVSQFKRNVSWRNVPAQDITLPSFANESKFPDISMPHVTPVSQFMRNMSLRDVPAQDITLPSFANESKFPDISMPHVKPVSQFMRNMSLRDVPAQDITLPSFAMNASEYDGAISELSLPCIEDQDPDRTCHIIDLTAYYPPEDSDTPDLSTSIAFDSSDPFDLDLIQKFISRLPKPLSSHPDYHTCSGPMPKIKLNKSACMVSLGHEEYEIVRKVGTGAFADVFLANVLDLEEDTGFDLEGNECVVKAQTPACPWEFYICTELAKRLRRLRTPVDASPFFMNIDKAYFYDDGCFFVNSYHKHGTLLNLVNAFKFKATFIPESVVMYLTISLLKILENMMAVDIIHGDMKPDNFLFVGMPHVTSTTNPDALLENSFPIKLIDFGRSIDMAMFPAGTTFTVKVDTDGFECIEMKTDRPWTYQTDYFGVIGTTHVLSFSTYMNVFLQGTLNKWVYSSRLRRNWKAIPLWTELNHTFLNIPNCESLPDVQNLRLRFEKFFKEQLFRNFIEKDAKLVDLMLHSAS